MLDANEYALKQYLRTFDDDARRKQMIDDRIVDLMAGEYRHDTGDAIVEAVSECNNKQYQEITEAAKGGAQSLGNAILLISLCYWTKMASDKAEEQVNDEWDSCRCHGQGCRSCRPGEE